MQWWPWQEREPSSNVSSCLGTASHFASDKERVMKGEVSLRVTALLLAISIAMCGYGVYSNEVKTVCKKATAICMECIGLG